MWMLTIVSIRWFAFVSHLTEHEYRERTDVLHSKWLGRYSKVFKPWSVMHNTVWLRNNMFYFCYSKVAGEIWVTCKYKGSCLFSEISVVIMCHDVFFQKYFSYTSFKFFNNYFGIVLMFNLDKAGKHGRIVRVNAINSTETSPLTATEGFRANLLTYNAVEIGLSDSTFTTIFVAPRSVYSNIHKKSVIYQ